MKRAQTDRIIKDLKKKIGLIVGPRQVGKTYLAREVSKHFNQPVYLNYDNLEDRKIIEEMSWISDTDLIVLDELHKMPLWKNYLKGVYDTKPAHLHILVTGSARLEIFDKVGDSLAGRYFLHRLLPFSPAELRQVGEKIYFNNLLERGGFPEPYLAPDNTEANRWRQYSNSILSTDVFDFDVIQNIRALRNVFELLRSKVGSPVSYQSIAEDVAISPNTVKKYIEILESLFVVFRITPFSKNIARSLLKEPKIYFYDNGLVKGDRGAQLENLVAICLLKSIYGRIDYEAEDCSLHYLRTKDGEEVDFAVVKDQEVETIIEVKYTDKEISKSLYGFNKKYNLKAVQLVKDLRQERMVGSIKLLKAEDYLAKLFL